MGGNNTICKTYLDPRLNTSQGTKIPFTYNDKLFYIKGVNSDSLFSFDTTGIASFKIKLPFDCFESINNGARQIVVNNKLIYIPGPNLTNLPSTGREPYYYDFETNTTGLVKDINPYFNYDSGVQLFQYSYFNRTNEKLAYFFAYNPDYGRELYYTDGTPNGTNITRDTKPGTADLCNLSCSAFYSGDTLILFDHFADSIRVYYKNIYYQKYKIPSTPNINTTINSYITLGSNVFFNINTNIDAFYKLGNINPIDSTICAIPSNNNGYNLFLKKDSCFYFASNSSTCIPNTTTGYELFKYCNSNIYLNSQTSINEQDLNNKHQILVYPNPSNSIINLSYANYASLSGYHIKITNTLGQLICDRFINQQTETIDVSTWGGNGIYFVRIIDQQGNTIDIRKIVLQ